MAGIIFSYIAVFAVGVLIGMLIELMRGMKELKKLKREVEQELRGRDNV